MKPMLAETWDEGKQRFPVIAQPKIDGVRALNLTGTLTGRSLKKFKNKYVTSMFSHSILLGLDGEMAAEHECHPDLCRLTTSALGRIEGKPYVLWHLFDYVTHETRSMPYSKRLQALRDRVAYIGHLRPELAQHLRIVRSNECAHSSVLEHFDSKWSEEGYEGTILRDPYGAYKDGRSTVREGGLLRIKRFVDSEAVVLSVTEGETNLNEAKTNALGQTERSTHQANMVANGMVGTLTCRALANCGPIKAGDTITVAAGRMTHAERQHYMALPNAIIGKTIKYKTFEHGAKDKLRFPTFQSIRLPEDMS